MAQENPPPTHPEHERIPQEKAWMTAIALAACGMLVVFVFQVNFEAVGALPTFIAGAVYGVLSIGVVWYVLWEDYAEVLGGEG